MLHSNKNIKELENINELILLQNHVQEVRIQDKLGKQNFQYDT